MSITARYQINIGIPLDAGKALDRFTSERGWTPTGYARVAVLEKLARDMGQHRAPETPADRRETTAQK